MNKPEDSIDPGVRDSGCTTVLPISHLSFSDYHLHYLSCGRGIGICGCNFYLVTRRVRVFDSLAWSSKLPQNRSSWPSLGQIYNLRLVTVAWEMTSVGWSAAPVRITRVEVNFPEEVDEVLLQHTKQQMSHSRPMTQTSPCWNHRTLKTSQRALIQPPYFIAVGAIMYSEN